MSEYRFSVIVSGSPASDDDILDAVDSLGENGCLDASVRGHATGMELLFEREASSLQASIQSAIADVERAGFCVVKVEMAREAIPA